MCRLEPLAVQLREHRHNLKEGLREKSKLAQHAYEEGHRVAWIKLGFWKLRVRADIENTRNRPIWRAQPTWSTQFGHLSDM
jgi:hypothetical protein